MTKKEFQDNCFSPNWLEIDLRDAREQNSNKEVRLESKHRKDLNTLLKELDEIKKQIESAVEKQRRLANLMGFYTNKLAQ